MPNNLTTREKQMLQALKIAQDAMRAHGFIVGAVDSIIKMSDPVPHEFKSIDKGWGIETCAICGGPSWRSIHNDPPRHWMVTSPDHPKVGLGRATDIREVKPITKEQSEKAWDQAFAIDKGGQYSNYGQHADGRLRYLELLGIQIED